MQQVPIVYKFGEVVTATDAALLTKLQQVDNKIQGIFYQHGHPIEIIQTLAQKDASPVDRFKKYPVILVFQDFPERRGIDGGRYGEITLQVVIAFHTEGDLTAEERYEKYFVPILYPIYEELLRQISKNAAFVVQNVQQIRHTKFDRVYWGRQGLYGNEGNVFNDRIDAIELRDLILTVNFSNCKIDS